MSKLSIVIFSALLSIGVTAQDTDPIATDRPDQTETPALVPPKMFQIETGIAYQKHDEISSITPSILWKYGVNSNFELRMITEFDVSNFDGQRSSGLTPILVGFKSKISEENGIWPKTSVIAHLALLHPSSQYYEIDYYAPEFRFTMQHTISNRMSLSYNLGAEWNGFSAQPTFIYTLATGFLITDKLGSYVELFGFAPQDGRSDHSFDGGFTYLISNNVMIDLSGGIGITENAPDYFAIGFSFRF